MAETKIVSVEAIQTIQELKDNIKALKKEVDSLSVGSEEYNEKVVELAENQRALKLAMTGTYGSMTEVAQASKLDTDAINSTVAAAKQGTATYYEMSGALGQLKNEIKNVAKYTIDAETGIKALNPKWEEMNSSIKVLDSSLKELDADNGVFGRNVGNYLGALEQWGGTMGQVKQVGNDLASGIMSLVGVMSLFGVDTENTKETLQSLVPILAVLNAGKGIGGLVKLLPKAAAGQKAVAVATAAAATANAADATAAGAATVATEAQTVAQEGLNKSMLANPVLAIVAGFTALVGIIAKYVSNANKAARETEDFKKQASGLTTQFEEQNTQLTRQQKILEAQGTAKNTLLTQQKEQIKAQKAETEALLANVNARLAQMKADSGWVRFWKGENKQIKNLEELTKQLTEDIKAMNNQIADIDTDIQVNSINKGKEAAKKYADTQKTEIKNAVNAANSAIKSQQTELERLNEEYAKNAVILNKGYIEAQKLLKKQKQGSKEWIQTTEDIAVISSGITANLHKFETDTANAKSKDYIKGLDSAFADLDYRLDKTTEKRQDLERLLNTVLGFSNAEAIIADALVKEENGVKQIVLGASTATNNLVSNYEKLGEVIEQDIRNLTGFEGALKDLKFGGLDWETMLSLSQVDSKKLAENVGEPLATAIGEWFKNNNALKDAVFQQWSETFASGEALIDDALTNKMPEKAQAIANGLTNILNTIFQDADDDTISIVNKYVEGLYKKIGEALINDEYTLNFEGKIEAILFGKGYKDGEVPFKDRFDAILKVSSDFLSTYVKSTSEALDAVSQLWEQSLKLRYKKMVESGKMTEEEAERQAEQGFQVVKAMQIGVAAVETAAAIVQALADPTVPSYYVKAANAIAAGIAGAAQIAQISMTEFGKPSIKTSTSATPSYTQAPSEVYFSYGINPNDYAEAQSETPIKAYVVDSDLAAGLNKYDQRNRETTF